MMWTWISGPELDNVGKCNVSTGACPDLRPTPSLGHVSPSANHSSVLRVLTNERRAESPALSTCHT